MTMETASENSYESEDGSDGAELDSDTAENGGGGDEFENNGGDDDVENNGGDDFEKNDALLLCSVACDSILSIRNYYESIDPEKQYSTSHPECQHHPWVFFIQWYRGKAYHMRHTPDPFDSSELYNVTIPSIKTQKYDIMFFRLGDLLNATSCSYGRDPYVLCYDRNKKKYDSFYLYASGAENRAVAMKSLKDWVSKAEGTDHKDAEVEALSVLPIRQISDIAKYDVNDRFPHMWALFLQYFVGAAFDISTCTRAIKPLERLFSDGIIYGSGYEIRVDDTNKVVHLDDTEYTLYGENGFKVLDSLKRDVFALERLQ